MRITSNQSDTFGALASSLCMLHCLATPILFVATSSAIDHHEASPAWWGWFNYFFLAISLWAVYRSAQTTTNQFVKNALWVSWSALLLVILNEQVHWLHLPETVTYIAAFSLVALHIYNRKFCECKTDSSYTAKD